MEGGSPLDGVSGGGLQELYYPGVYQKPEVIGTTFLFAIEVFLHTYVDGRDCLEKGQRNVTVNILLFQKKIIADST